MKKENQCRNSMIEEYEDLPRPKVKRHDGLPTVDDLKGLLKSKEAKEPKEGSSDGKNLSINIHVNKSNEQGGLEGFIERILAAL